MLIPLLLFTTHVRGSAPNFRTWGLEALEHIQSDLAMPGSALFGESAKPGEPPSAVAFDWGVGVTLSALNAAARVDRDYKPRLKSYLDAVQTYWNPAGPVAGYDVLPGPKKPDRYYDDNEWMVLALVEASDLLGSKPALAEAKQAYKYVISGEDDHLGGGIYWREAKRNSKNTCSNAPAAACALALYRKTHDKSLLKEAEKLYAWTRAHLRDPADGLYWDNISLNGRVGKTKWSYNTGLMLRDAAELFACTKEQAYTDDARELQHSSLKAWVNPNGSLRDDGKFMHLLLENWLKAFKLVPGADDPRPAIEAGLEYLHSNSLDTLGHYGNRWDEPADSKTHSPFALIDQASAARAYLEAWMVFRD